MVENTRAKIEYNKNQHPERQSNYRKLDYLKQEYNTEKALLLIKRDREINQAGTDEDLKNQIRLRTSIEIANLEDKMVEKAKEITGEAEKQLRIKELEKKLMENPEDNKGGMYSLEEMNQRSKDESELFRLKAGFSSGMQGQEHGGSPTYTGQDHGQSPGSYMGQDHPSAKNAYENRLKAQFGFQNNIELTNRQGDMFNDLFKESGMGSDGYKMRGNQLTGQNNMITKFPLLPIEVNVVTNGQSVGRSAKEIDLHEGIHNENFRSGRRHT